MRSLLNPKWIFLINTIPIIVLFIFFIGEFNVIKSLLNEENLSLWKSFGVGLLGLGIINFVYPVYLILKRQNTSVWYAAIALPCYIIFIYLYGYHSSDIIPLTIPRWMLPGDMILYVGTFLMPTLAYSLFILVIHLTPETSQRNAWSNFLMAIVAPFSCYILSQTLLPLWKPVEENYGMHVLVILMTMGIVICLFFIIRSVFILVTNKSEIWHEYQLAWKIPITTLFPILGLAINNGHLSQSWDNSGIFGNFTNLGFYVLALLNGIALCLPNIDKRGYRLSVFIFRSIGFAYTFYFFIVFLPFLPLGIIAIVAFGLGFLMLTPLMLFIIHVSEISRDFAYLKERISKKLLWLICSIAFSIIPICITVTYVNDRKVLNETLEYLYSPDYTEAYNIDKSSLKSTIDVIKYHKDRDNSGISGVQIPYLSTYFNWVVLDNLTLSDGKINTIERVFWGETSFELRPESAITNDVKVSKISTRSNYDKKQGAWISWIDLELTNHSENTGFSEYATTIDLPEGCWISDYYLYVGNKKEKGILAEKKSAMWVFSQIRNENRDPGILYYLTGNKIAFKIFPFAKKEVRKTGIELLHKAPISLIIDSNIVQLGDEKINVEPNTFKKTLSPFVEYVSPSLKKRLKQIRRKPYYHFLVDVSKGNEKNTNNFIKRIDSLKLKDEPTSEQSKISFVNSYTTTSFSGGNWKQEFLEQPFEGGFYLDRAIKKVLVESYNNNNRSYPIIVVVTDSLQNAFLDKDFSDYEMAFPESDLFYVLGRNDSLHQHSLLSNPGRRIAEMQLPNVNATVREYLYDNGSVAYLPDNNQSSIFLKKKDIEIDEATVRERSWESAAVIHGKWLSQVLYPKKSNSEWQKLVKYSFLLKVMSPVTSYLVVENEAQKAALKRKQDEVLNGNKSLDLSEDTQRMSEPGIFVLGALLLIVLWIRHNRGKIKFILNR